MRIHALVTTVSLLSGAVALAALQKPDFSGEWTLNKQASTLSPFVATVQSGVLRIEHREPMFRYQSTLVFEGKPLAVAFERLTDGREVTDTQQGRTFVSSLRWDGDALVFAGRTQGADSELTISFRYELLEGARRLRAAEQVRGRGRDQDNVWVFERP